jgi:hypothetical protein
MTGGMNLTLTVIQAVVGVGLSTPPLWFNQILGTCKRQPLVQLFVGLLRPYGIAYRLMRTSVRYSLSSVHSRQYYVWLASAKHCANVNSHHGTVAN